jgi:hypothetical protein
MKESESSFDVMASVRDLQAMVGGYVDKIYHPTLDHLILSVRTPGEGKTFIHFWVGRWLYASGAGQEGGKQPSDFAMMLRKRLTNAKITAIRQQGFDRIAVLTLEKEGPWELVLEHHSGQRRGHCPAIDEPHVEAQRRQSETRIPVPTSRARSVFHIRRGSLQVPHDLRYGPGKDLGYQA